MIDAGRIGQILSSRYVRSPFLVAAEEHAENLRVHAEGSYSAKLLGLARPNEEDQYKQYRKDAFKSATKKAFSRVVTALGKVKLAEDWRISFNAADEKRFLKGESLEAYVTKNYPGFDSLENWFFSLALKTMCHDPNTVVAVFPLEQPAADTDYYKPFTYLFASTEVIHYEEGKLAVLRDELPGVFQAEGAEPLPSTIYHVLDREEYQVWQKVEDAGQVRYYLTNQLLHSIGYLPAFQLGGVVEKYKAGQILWRSWLDPCLDDWDEAVRRYSDHQVNMVLHLHPDRWEISDQNCTAPGCEKGKVKGTIIRKGLEKPTLTNCQVCSGSGRTSIRSPFGVKFIKPFVQRNQTDAVTIPTPPMGNVNRDIGSLTYLKDEYKDKIKQGLDALNMGFLDLEPGVNSGYAKALDREEMNTFFTNVAAHIVHNILRPCYFFINEWRNRRLIPDQEDREALQPQINIPTKFDLVYAQLSAERAKFAKESGFSPTVTSELELQYAIREFGESSPQARMIRAIVRLDPLPHKTVDEKLAMVSSRGTSQVNYVVSCNLHAFLIQSIQADPDFLNREYVVQLTRLRELAAEIVNENTAALVNLDYDEGARGLTGGD